MVDHDLKQRVERTCYLYRVSQCELSRAAIAYYIKHRLANRLRRRPTRYKEADVPISFEAVKKIAAPKYLPELPVIDIKGLDFSEGDTLK